MDSTMLKLVTSNTVVSVSTDACQPLPLARGDLRCNAPGIRADTRRQRPEGVRRRTLGRIMVTTAMHRAEPSRLRALKDEPGNVGRAPRLGARHRDIRDWLHPVWHSAACAVLVHGLVTCTVALMMIFGPTLLSGRTEYGQAGPTCDGADPGEERSPCASSLVRSPPGSRSEEAKGSHVRPRGDCGDRAKRG